MRPLKLIRKLYGWLDRVDPDKMIKYCKTKKDFHLDQARLYHRALKFYEAEKATQTKRE